jgi:hypothetical protein
MVKLQAVGTDSENRINSVRFLTISEIATHSVRVKIASSVSWKDPGRVFSISDLRWKSFLASKDSGYAAQGLLEVGFVVVIAVLAGLVGLYFMKKFWELKSRVYQTPDRLHRPCFIRYKSIMGSTFPATTDRWGNIEPWCYQPSSFNDGTLYVGHQFSDQPAWDGVTFLMLKRPDGTLEHVSGWPTPVDEWFLLDVATGS